jgi:hypothetical protein
MKDWPVFNDKAGSFFPRAVSRELTTIRLVADRRAVQQRHQRDDNACMFIALDLGIKGMENRVKVTGVLQTLSPPPLADRGAIFPDHAFLPVAAFIYPT